MGFVKVHAELWDGSLIGRPQAQLVFLFLLAHADAAGSVDIAQRKISALTGLDAREVQAAIDELEAPDSESRRPEEQGRRLVRLDPDRSYGWRVVNYGHYRNARSVSDRREQNRQAQQRRREKLTSAAPVSDSQPGTLTKADGQPRSAQAEAEAEAEEPRFKTIAPNGESKTEPTGEAPPPTPEDAVEARAAFAGDESGNPTLELPEPVQRALEREQAMPGDRAAWDSQLLPFPVRERGVVWWLSQGQVDEWRQVFPDLDVLGECRVAHAWCTANAGKRKTPAGMNRFLVRWLTKAHNDRAARGHNPRARTDAGYAKQVRVIGDGGSDA